MSLNSHAQNQTILAAMANLWKLRFPGPDDIQNHEAFLLLRDACGKGRSDTNSMGFKFALSSALRSLGMPCGLEGENSRFAMPYEVAAARLEEALSATSTKRTYLAPLDLAEELPEMAFGTARVCRFTPEELRDLFNEPRLNRFFPDHFLETDRFSEFYWLVVEVDAPLNPCPGKRALPFLSLNINQDFGRIEPHKERFPVAFEEALFFLTLAPWEEWSMMHEVEWRAFRVPWVYSTDHDLFVSPSPPPSPDTLSWEPHILSDGSGGEVEVERPVTLPLRVDKGTVLKYLCQNRWESVQRARRSVLFETPVEHFILRAHWADGMDEFLAHVTAIEAALGAQSDYRPGMRVTPDRHPRWSATKKMKWRVAGLLGDQRFAADYGKLFDLRSAFLHGRNMNHVSSQDRILARSLARRVVESLVNASQTGGVLSRESFLDDLLDRGSTLAQDTNK